MTRRLTALALVLTLSLTGCCWEAEPEPDDFWGDELPPEEQETSQREPAQISDFTLPYLSGQAFDPVTCIDGVQQTVGALLYGKAYFVLNDSVKSDMLAGDFAMRWEITQNINIKSITGTVQRTDEGLVAYYDELIALNE